MENNTETNDDFSVEEEKVENVKVKLFSCAECNKSFSKEIVLKSHQDIYHKFKCIMCISSFKNESLLKMHIERNHSVMTQKITKDNLTSEKQDCSTRNLLPRDTTMAQKSHGKIKISKLYWLNCRMCPFKTRKQDLMIEHMCSAHIGNDNVETNNDRDKVTAASGAVEKKSKTKNSKVKVENPSDRETFDLPHGWTKLVVYRRNQPSMGGKIRQDIYLIPPGSEGKKFQSDAQLHRFLQENPDIECDLSVTSTKATVHREFLMNCSFGSQESSFSRKINVEIT